MNTYCESQKQDLWILTLKMTFQAFNGILCLPISTITKRKNYGCEKNVEIYI